jgi:hypothetical protein
VLSYVLAPVLDASERLDGSGSIAGHIGEIGKRHRFGATAPKPARKRPAIDAHAARTLLSCFATRLARSTVSSGQTGDRDEALRTRCTRQQSITHPGVVIESVARSGICERREQTRLCIAIEPMRVMDVMRSNNGLFFAVRSRGRARSEASGKRNRHETGRKSGP